MAWTPFRDADWAVPGDTFDGYPRATRREARTSGGARTRWTVTSAGSGLGPCGRGIESQSRRLQVTGQRILRGSVIAEERSAQLPGLWVVREVRQAQWWLDGSIAVTPQPG